MAIKVHQAHHTATGSSVSHAPIDNVFLEALLPAKSLELSPVTLDIVPWLHTLTAGPNALQPKVLGENGPALGPRQRGGVVANVERLGVDLLAGKEGCEDTELSDDVLVRVGRQQVPAIFCAREGDAGSGSLQGSVQSEEDTRGLGDAVSIAEWCNADLVSWILALT